MEHSPPSLLDDAENNTIKTCTDCFGQTGTGKQCQPRSDMKKMSYQALHCVPVCLRILDTFLFNMSLVVRKPVFGVSDQVR